MLPAKLGQNKEQKERGKMEARGRASEVRRRDWEGWFCSWCHHMNEGQRSRCGHCDQGSRPSSSQSSATPWSRKRYRDDDSGRGKKREKLEHDLQYHRKDVATPIDKKKDKRRPHERASRRSSPSPHRRAKVRSLPPHQRRFNVVQPGSGTIALILFYF